MWRLRGGRLQPGYPALASRHWQGLPSPVDAAFEDAQGHIWFFQGEWARSHSGDCWEPGTSWPRVGTDRRDEQMDRWRGPQSLGAQGKRGSRLWAQLGGFLEEAVLEAGVGWKVLHPVKHV